MYHTCASICLYASRTHVHSCCRCVRSDEDGSSGNVHCSWTGAWKCVDKVDTQPPSHLNTIHNAQTVRGCSNMFYHHRHTHTHLTALCPGLPGWASSRKVKPIWILLKQETVSGSGISWAICKSSPRSKQITMPAPHHSVFYRPDALPAAQPTASKYWRQMFHHHQSN